MNIRNDGLNQTAKWKGLLKNNKMWMDGSVKFEKYGDYYLSKKRGRPQASFEDSSDRTKRRKTSTLRIQMSLRASSEAEASKVVREVTLSPRRASKYRKLT